MTESTVAFAARNEINVGDVLDRAEVGRVSLTVIVLCFSIRLKDMSSSPTPLR
jgi:hypothetical protein